MHHGVKKTRQPIHPAGSGVGPIPKDFSRNEKLKKSACAETEEAPRPKRELLAPVLVSDRIILWTSSERLIGRASQSVRDWGLSRMRDRSSANWPWPWTHGG